jgi:hypothetical protein
MDGYLHQIYLRQNDFQCGIGQQPANSSLVVGLNIPELVENVAGGSFNR